MFADNLPPRGFGVVGLLSHAYQVQGGTGVNIAAHVYTEFIDGPLDGANANLTYTRLDADWKPPAVLVIEPGLLYRLYAYWLDKRCEIVPSSLLYRAVFMLLRADERLEDFPVHRFLRGA